MDTIYSRLQEFEPELRHYLTQRFGSASLASRVTDETLATMQASDVLQVIGNPCEYVTGYALALALRYRKEDRRREAP